MRKIKNKNKKRCLVLICCLVLVLGIVVYFIVNLIGSMGLSNNQGSNNSITLNEKDIYEILEKSENGTEDIISTKSKIMKEGNYDLEKMSMSQLVRFILDNPTVLKRPIIVDDNKIQIGYNSEEIRAFIPEEIRRLVRLTCAKGACERYEFCEHKDDFNNQNA